MSAVHHPWYVVTAVKAKFGKILHPGKNTQERYNAGGYHSLECIKYSGGFDIGTVKFATYVELIR